MSEKINVVDRSPYKAWRVNFCDQGDGMTVVFTAVIDAPDFHTAWHMANDHYRAMSVKYITRVEREDRPPSEWEKPLA